MTFKKAAIIFASLCCINRKENTNFNQDFTPKIRIKHARSSTWLRAQLDSCQLQCVASLVMVPKGYNYSSNSCLTEVGKGCMFITVKLFEGACLDRETRWPQMYLHSTSSNEKRALCVISSSSWALSRDCEITSAVPHLLVSRSRQLWSGVRQNGSLLMRCLT